jgi:hypothetical protein
VAGISPGRVVVGPPLCTLVVVCLTVVGGIDVVVGPPICTVVVVLVVLVGMVVVVTTVVVVLDDGVVGGYASAIIGDTKVIANITPRPARHVDTMLRHTACRRSSLLMTAQSNDRRPHVK